MNRQSTWVRYLAKSEQWQAEGWLIGDSIGTIFGVFNTKESALVVCEQRQSECCLPPIEPFSSRSTVESYGF
jgi:hypothetical protein